MSDEHRRAADQTLETLVAVIAQGRREDREDLAEMKNEMRELTRSMTKLTNVTTEFVTNQKHTDSEIDDLKLILNGDKGLVNRVSELEIAQAEDKRNWLFVGFVVATIFTAFVGYYFTVVKPVQQSNVQSNEIKTLIQDIKDVLVQP